MSAKNVRDRYKNKKVNNHMPKTNKFSKSIANNYY